jgi:hypothetical protein
MDPATYHIFNTEEKHQEKEAYEESGSGLPNNKQKV